MGLGQWISGLLDTLAPPCCAACDTPCSETFCDACGAPSRLARQSFDELPLLVAGPYAPPLSTAIQRFKYEGRADLARSLAGLVVPQVATLPLPHDAVFVPVPLHPRRLAERGYNQAALLARELANSQRLGCAPRLLQRVRETERQVGKLRAARVANATDAFELRGSLGASAILVDDVVTTGSTVRACAQALAAGGVRVMAVVAIARALPADARGLTATAALLHDS